MTLETFDPLTTDVFSKPSDSGTVEDNQILDLLPLDQPNFVDLSKYIQSLVDHYNQQILILNQELEEIKNQLD
tara:strand:- start:647 stop:865 length:219 start_codon:yes stop_codon:yes gene_type:complete